MGLVCEKPVSIDVDRLLDLAKHDDLGIRAKALELLVNCGSDRLCQSFAAGDWRYDNETMERAEAILGSYLLIWHAPKLTIRSEEHTSEIQSLMRNSYAVFCLQKK